MKLYSLYVRKEAHWVAGYHKTKTGALVLACCWGQGPRQPNRRYKRVMLNGWNYAARWMKPSKRVLFERHRNKKGA